MQGGTSKSTQTSMKQTVTHESKKPPNGDFFCFLIVRVENLCFLLCRRFFLHGDFFLFHFRRCLCARFLFLYAARRHSLEPINASRRVNDFFLTRIEWVTVRTDLNDHLFFC